MRIYAHRGASYYAPENTMAAFELAGSMGADGMELDVQLTKDGALIVLHDDTLDRTTNGKGYAMDWLFEDLRRLDAGSFYSKEYAGERIPTLEEVLRYLKTTDMRLNIEIKTWPPRYRKALAEATAACIKRMEVEDRILISSFDHRALVDFRSCNREVPMGILYSEYLYRPAEYVHSVGADAIHPWFINLDADTVRHCHENGVAVNTWTVDEPEDFRRLEAMGVDIIISDKPDIQRLSSGF